MKKVLYILNSFPPAGGAEKVAWDLMHCALEHYNVHVMVFSNDNKELPDQRIHVHYLNNTSNNLRHYLTQGRKEILDLIRSIKPDIIHAHAPTVIAHIAGKYKRSLNIMTFHHSFVDKYKWSKFRRLKFKYFQSAAARRYKIITTMSEHMENYFRKTLKRDIVLIGNGYNSEIFFNKNKEKKSKSVLFVGQLTIAKGVDILFEIAKKMKDHTFTFVGEGNLKNTINLPNLNFVGLKSAQELSEYYNSHMFSIFPSKYENFPLVGLEAMACGSIVIASDKGFPAYIDNGKNGFILKNPTQETISKAIHDVSDMDSIVINAVNSVQEHTWTSVFKKYRSIYESN